MSLINGHYTVQNCNSAPSITSHNKTSFTGGVNSFVINIMDYDGVLFRVQIKLIFFNR